MKATIPGLPLGWSINHSNPNPKHRARIQRGVKSAVRDYIPIRVHPIEGSVGLMLDFYPPDRRRRDLDNLISKCKPLIDVLVERGWIADDNQITYIQAEKCQPDKANPRTEVSMFEI